MKALKPELPLLTVRMKYSGYNSMKCELIISLKKKKIVLLFKFSRLSNKPASILHKSIAGHYRPVSYPDGPIMARYRFM